MNTEQIESVVRVVFGASNRVVGLGAKTSDSHIASVTEAIAADIESSERLRAALNLQ
jgi:hypothetical protein